MEGEQCFSRRSKWKKYSSRKILYQFVAIASMINFSAGCENCARNAMELRTLETALSTPYFGGCFNNSNKLLTCAFGPSNCSPSTDYLQPTEINGTYCHSPIHVKTGRCTSSLIDFESENGPCTPFPTSCITPSLHTESNNTCSIQEDRSGSSYKLAQYPHCRTKARIDPNRPYRCVLSKDECISGREDFCSIGTPLTEPCSCYDVPTGICYMPSRSKAVIAATSFCAVAAYDCPPGSIFMTAYELDNTLNLPKLCRLCQKENIGNYRLENITEQINYISTSNVKSAIGDNELSNSDLKKVNDAESSNVIQTMVIYSASVCVIFGIIIVSSIKHKRSVVVQMRPSNRGSIYGLDNIYIRRKSSITDSIPDTVYE